MNTDLADLEKTYKKIYEVSLQISQLIDREIYSELVTFISKKEHLFNEAEILVEKVNAQNLDTACLKDICKKIYEQEQINLVALNKIKSEIKEELFKTSKNKKLVSAYANMELIQGNILDYRQ